MARKEPNPLRRRRHIRQAIGAIVCLLVVVGLVNVVQLSIKGIVKITDNSAEKEEYEVRLRNLVTYDPLPFDNLTEANQQVLLAASIWGTLDISDKSAFERDETDQLYLPAVDIDNYTAKLYGTKFKFNHASFEDHGLMYEYVAEKQAYVIPITSALSEYYPQVVKIKNEKDAKRVTVGYLSFNSTLTLNGAPTTPEITKYMDYIFTKDGKNTFLSAIEESEMKATTAQSGASSSASSSANIDDFVDENIPQSLIPSQSPTSSAPAADSATPPASAAE